MKNLIDFIRYKFNNIAKYDVVHFSGQHNLRSHLTKIIDLYGLDSIIDVGANEGQFGLFVRSIGFKGKIYSFEPVAEAFRKLSEVSANDDNWSVFEFALGAEEGEALINVSSFSSFSSILNINEYGKSNWENSKVDHSERIAIKTLDGCFAEGLISEGRRFLLKMDTQGYDLQVFKGGEKNLSFIPCILSELSIIPVYDEMPNYTESLAAFKDKGFSPSGFYPITRNQDLSLNEVDCMLVNTSSFTG